VRDEENGDALGAEFVDLAHAALAEVDVADREGFVDRRISGSTWMATAKAKRTTIPLE